ncbi:Deleted in malignant brain tumors 1 protein, partial [Geodia barretti]
DIILLVRVAILRVGCLLFLEKHDSVCLCLAVTAQQCSEDGEVRLVGGENVNQSGVRGRVEICINHQWGTVCSDDWGLLEARVTCRQMGFDYAVPIAEYGGGSGKIHSFSCVGDETHLGNCSGDMDITYCGHSEDAGAMCSDFAECNETGVRLVDGVTPDDGRVEICLGGVWGSVCDDTWDIRDVRVVCRQLGYNGTSIPLLSYPVISSNGSLFYHLDEVDCTGDETLLSDCEHGGLGIHDCRVRFEEAGVICNATVECNETGVRLVDGVTPDDGRVEICLSRVWGSVCDDLWDVRDARVVCRQLGYYGISFPLQSHPVRMNDSILFYHLDDVECRGNENMLSDCGHEGIGVHNCFVRFEEAGVICSDAVIIDGPKGVEDSLVFMGQVTCRGSEKYLNECIPDIMPLAGGGCSRAAISCGKSSNQPKCTRNDSVLLSDVYKSYGECSVYKWETAVCEGVVRRGIDSVYARSRLGDQSTIAQLLNESIKDVERLIADHADSCVDQVFRALCNFYLPPCGNATHPVPPSSICQTECEMVLQNCQTTWDAVMLAFKTVDPIPDCNDTSRLLFPVPNCCTGAGLGNFDQEDVERFVEESLKMSRFKHAHVMGLIGVCLDAGSAPFIIMPYMANGSLLKYLKRERKNVVLLEETDEDEVKEVRKRLMVMCLQIASGMEYLASNKIDTHFQIKITDFGLSEDVFERNYFRQDSGCGEVVKLPVKWMAPESLNDRHFSEKSDVWSYGVTMWEVFSGGKAPYPATDLLTLMQSLEQGHPMPQPYNAACSEEIFGIMGQCWQMEPRDRPTFKEICSTLSKFIECEAGYLQFGFSPFTDGGEGGGGEVEGGEEGRRNNEDEKEEKEKEFI